MFHFTLLVSKNVQFIPNVYMPFMVLSIWRFVIKLMLLLKSILGSP